MAAQITSADEDAGAPPDVYVSPERAWDSLHDADLSVFEPRFAAAAELLGVDDVALGVLWLCAAPELDDRYGRVFAYLLDNASRRLPTPRLIATVLGHQGIEREAVLGCLSTDGPLRRYGCVSLPTDERSVPLLDQPVRVADELMAYMLGASLREQQIDGRLLRWAAPTHPVGRGHSLARIRAALATPADTPLLVAGPDAADLLAVAVSRDLMLVDARAAGDSKLIARARLYALLERRAVAFHRADGLEPAEITTVEALVEATPERVLLCAAAVETAARLAPLAPVVVEIPMPTLGERRAAWEALAQVDATEEVATKFRLSTGQIAGAVQIARVEAEMAGLAAPGPRELDAGARRTSSSGLGERATRVVPGGGWDDMVLPERQLTQLRAVSAYLRHRDQVLAEWGYERTVAGRQGLGVLFAGESGTGKTMAARVLAADLGLELFAIDLATVVSKYVGETEQNLERIFSAAAGSNAILLFDEADALFGRRSEVSDARDRYANIEVAYLLQRMEAHAGAVILATNLKQNIDDAFLRRLDFVVEFRFPEAADRRRIWSRVIPAEAPLDGEIDLDFLGEHFALSGGSIRNCSLAAAFEAASTGQGLRMAHFVRAISAEYGKLGRLTVESEFGPYFDMLRDPEASPRSEPEPAPPSPPAPPHERLRIGSRIEEL